MHLNPFLFFILSCIACKCNHDYCLVWQESDLWEVDEAMKSSFNICWKGQSGLYSVGFTRKGLSRASFDGMKVVEDIENVGKLRPSCDLCPCFFYYVRIEQEYY